MRPNASSAVRAISIADAALATSSLAQTAVPFSARTSSSVCAQSLMSAMTTRAPRLPKYRAYSCPIPRAAPVITMTFSSTFMAISLHRLDHCTGRGRGADAVRDRQQLDFSGLKLWPHDRQRRHVHLHASLGEIVGGLDRVAIGDFGHRQVLALEKTGEQEVERPGHSRPIEL